MRKKILVVVLFSIISSLYALSQDNYKYLIAYTDSTSSDYELIGYKSKEGRVIISAQYLLAPDTLSGNDFVVKDGFWIMINMKGDSILRPFIYDNGPDYLEEGLFRFVENNKMGFANMKGEKVIPATFDFVYPFEKGKAEYIMGGYKEYLDSEHWIWTEGYEIGYITKKGRKVKK